MRRFLLMVCFGGLLLTLGTSASFADALSDLTSGYFNFANYTETSSGFVSGPIPICCELSGVSVNIASDDEASFDPFGAGYDTSDGIQFTGAGNFVVSSLSSAWNSAGTNTWVLPATIPGCGSENGTTCEPTGIFTFNTAWTGIPSYIAIFDPDGTTLSDVLLFDSNGPGGDFEVKFYSDPTFTNSTPEPATLALALFGIVGLGLGKQFKRRVS